MTPGNKMAHRQSWDCYFRYGNNYPWRQPPHSQLSPETTASGHNCSLATTAPSKAYYFQVNFVVTA